ncbi:hypothetical protein PAMP_017624 [Pampus punctatissimus]
MTYYHCKPNAGSRAITDMNLQWVRGPELLSSPPPPVLLSLDAPLTHYCLYAMGAEQA